MEETVVTMASFITDMVTPAVTLAVTTVGQAFTVITEQPLALLTVGFLVLGGGFGLVNRAISKR